MIAAPKSEILMSPSLGSVQVNRMFAGLMSRWMMPAWKAKSSARGALENDLDDALDR
jgi:hypothetical protein